MVMPGQCCCFIKNSWMLRQILASIFCSLSAIVVGNCVTWLEPFAKELISSTSDIPMDSNTFGWITSIMEVSDAAMSLPAGILMDKWGRKKVLLMTGPICLISWLMVAFTRNIVVLYIVRLIQGCVEAMVLAVAPVYLAEISSPSIRGALIAKLSLFTQLGVLYTYLISSIYTYEKFIYISMSLPVVFFITFLFVPESPYYYLMKKQKHEAGKALSWFRANIDINEELTKIQRSVETDMNRKVGYRDLIATKNDRRAFLIVQVVVLSAMFSGVVTIVEYAKQTFSIVPLIWFNEDQMTVIMGFVMCVSAFVSIFLSDTIGRRKLLLVTSVGVTLSNFIICIYYFLHEMTSINVVNYVWVMYIGMLFLSIISNLGSIQLMRVIQAEFFPSHTRGIGGGITGVIASIWIFIGLKIYLPIIKTFGVYMNFLIYTLVSFFSTILIAIYVPESAGKTLEEINININSVRLKNVNTTKKNITISSDTIPT